MKTQLKKIKIINYLINPISISNLLKFILNSTKGKKSKYICVSNVHSCVESFKNKKFKIAHNSSNLALADGRPIFWALKLLGYSSAEHLPGYYVTEKLCDLSNKNKLNIGFYGSTDVNLKKIQKNLKKKYKQLKIKYIYSPPFRTLSKLEEKKIVSNINKSKIDILFVALGAPKQEIWMYDNYKKIKCVSIGIGAAIDFISGNKRMAPRFMELFGFAWLFRLITEPRRLFFRYLITNTLFIFLFTIQFLKFKINDGFK